MSLCLFPVQENESALHLASERGHIQVVRVLINACADINRLDTVCAEEGLNIVLPCPLSLLHVSPGVFTYMYTPQIYLGGGGRQ